MPEGLEYVGQGRFSELFPLGAYTTRVQIKGSVSVTPDGPPTMINVQAEYFDENMNKRVQTFGPVSRNKLDFEFWAGTNETDPPQLHEPKIRIQLPIGVTAGVSWYVANQMPLRVKQARERIDLSELDANWMRTGLK